MKFDPEPKETGKPGLHPSFTSSMKSDPEPKETGKPGLHFLYKWSPFSFMQSILPPLRNFSEIEMCIMYMV
jgi:hypothetical protein